MDGRRRPLLPRLAQDLHDEVNQSLTGILLRLEATTGAAPESLRPERRAAKALARQAMEELLTLARRLRPTTLDDHGLVAAPASQVEDFGDREIEASFTRHGMGTGLSGEEQLVVYRITQESLSNVARHTRAERVEVELSFAGADPPAGRPLGPDEPPSPREQGVLKLIAEAHANKQIAVTLRAAEKTVESHRANLLRKLRMRDRVELVRCAIRRGLIEA